MGAYPRPIPDQGASKMRALMTCVGMDDYLEVSLPWNRGYFESTLIVTNDGAGLDARLARKYGALVFVTNAFTRDGHPFNKYLATEEALDAMGREGWLCLLDADILLPRAFGEWSMQHRNRNWLYSPLRRMHPNAEYAAAWAKTYREEGRNGDPAFLQEESWASFPLHGLHTRMPWHFSGYCQIFHASDFHLGAPPWHRTDLPDAGAGDTYFQNKWPNGCKVRPPWEVLHIGDPSRANWRGRVTPRIDEPIKTQ